MVSVSEDIYEHEEDPINDSLQRYSRTPSATSREVRLRIPATIEEGHSAKGRQYKLNIGKIYNFHCETVHTDLSIVITMIPIYFLRGPFIILTSSPHF